MANLGSNNTAVEGDDFSLPAGAQLDEESGDLVIRDSGGSVVFRRDETAGEWVTDSVKTDDATVSNGPSGDDDALRWQEGVEVLDVVMKGADNSAGNNLWGQSEVNQATFSFSSAFNATPIEAALKTRSNGGVQPADRYAVETRNSSATGVDVLIHTMRDSDDSGIDHGVRIVATEGR